MKFLIAGALLLALFIPPIENRYFITEVLGLGFLLCLFAQRMFEETTWEAAALFLYVTLYGLYQWALPFMAENALGPIGAERFGSQVVGASITLILFVAALLFAKKDILAAITASLFFFGILDSILVIVRGLTTGLDNAWFVGSNPSQDACFIGLLLPMGYLVAEKKKRLHNYAVVGLMIAAILITKASTGLACIGITAAGYWVKKNDQGSKWKTAFLFLVIAMGGSLFLGKELMNDNGRYGVWKQALEFYVSGPTLLQAMGYGPGSFFVYGPAMQAANGVTTDIFMWMHNDWLQIFFELGAFGLVMALIFWWQVLKRCKEPVAFSMALTYGSIMFIQFPLHTFPLQLIGLCIVWMAF